MQKLNPENIWNEDEKKMVDGKKYESICKRYFNRLEEINQEVMVNELFIFSILAGKIKAAKAIWKRGRVIAFKIYVIFCY
jgi:hypothetical protein